MSYLETLEPIARDVVAQHAPAGRDQLVDNGVREGIVLTVGNGGQVGPGDRQKKTSFA